MRSLPPLTALTLSLGLLIAPAPAPAAEEEVPAHLRAEEPPPTLRTETPSRDPVQEQLALAANPLVPEAEAQRIFDELVARGAAAVPSVAAVLRTPTSTDQEAWVAARALGRLGGAGAKRALLEGLLEPRIIVRLGAVSGLGLLADKETAEPLERALFDKAMVVRAAAADALASIGSRQSSVALSKALNLPANFHHGRSHFVRRHIVDALGRIGSIGGIEALIGVLAEEEPPLQIAAAVALESITGTSFRTIGSAADSPPTAAEAAQWRSWWAQRSVGTIAE